MSPFSQVIIADICDHKFHDITQKHRMALSNAADDLPEYRSYRKSWWEEEFEGQGHLVSIKHVTVPQYIRRTERYVVYIEKNAPTVVPTVPSSVAHDGEEGRVTS